MIRAGSLQLLALLSLSSVYAKLPSYIHVCKRHDPNIDRCIINSIEKLRYKLISGIPELEVPSMEPLFLHEIVVPGGGAFRAVGKNVTVRGASQFKIKELKANVINPEYRFTIHIPTLSFDANYDVNAKILAVVLKGNGPIQANATNVEGVGILKGHKETENGRTYVKFDSLDLKLKIKNYNVRLENLFNGDTALGEAVNVALNENKKELMQVLMPRVEETSSKVLLDLANKITTNFEYEDLFPL